MMIKALVFCGILIVHCVAQLVAWTYAHAVFPQPLAWQILSVPMGMLAGTWTEAHFWLVASLNSILWAVAGTYLIGRFAFQRPAAR